MHQLNEFLSPSVALDITLLRRNRLPKHWQIGHRTLDEHMIYLVRSHAITVRVEEKPYHLQPGSLLWLQPGIAHSCAPIDRKQHIELDHIRFTTTWQGDHQALFLRHNRNDLIEPFSRLLEEYRSRSTTTNDRLRAQLFLFLHSVLVPYEQPHGCFSSAQVEQLHRLFERSTNLRLDISMLAKELGLNQDYLSRTFKRTFHLAPRTWLARERIRRIAETLQTQDISLNDIADAYGYSDVHDLNRQFRKFIGISPGKYSDQHCQPNEIFAPAASD